MQRPGKGKGSRKATAPKLQSSPKLGETFTGSFIGFETGLTLRIRNALRILNQNTFPADPQSTQNTIYWQNESVKALKAHILLPF